MSFNACGRISVGIVQDNFVDWFPFPNSSVFICFPLVMSILSLSYPLLEKRELGWDET
jgi:hypothetical protein